MRHVKSLNILLWGVNLLHVAGIGIFAFVYLVFPKPPRYLDGIWDGMEQTQAGVAPRRVNRNYSVLWSLENPLKKGSVGSSNPTGPASSAFAAELQGTWPPEGAFIRIGGRQTIAMKDKPIEYDGTEIAEARGWWLKECYHDGAVFTNGKLEVPLKIAEPKLAGSGVGEPVRVGATGPYDESQFATRRTHKSPGRETYLMDPKEIEWAEQNFESVLENDCKLSTSGAGGLRVDSVRAGSIMFSRGMRDGDMIESVNGQKIQSLADIKKISGGPEVKSRNSLTLVVQRHGRPVVFVYQAPGRRQ